MSELTLEVSCSRCKSEITHICNTDLHEAAVGLFRLEDCREGGLGPLFKRRGGTAEEAENAPVLSEAFLYPLLGKEAARTVLARVNNVLRAAGLDPYALQEEAWKLDEKGSRR